MRNIVIFPRFGESRCGSRAVIMLIILMEINAFEAWVHIKADVWKGESGLKYSATASQNAFSD
jgi:hypothetical protein